jgi:hypothetical protein
MWLETSGKRYPRESWDLDFDNDYYSLAYDAFQEYKKATIRTDSIPHVDKKKALKLFSRYSALIYQISLKVLLTQKVILYFMLNLTILLMSQLEQMKEQSAI